MSDTVEKIKCLIIGSGPAGYTAAIYAARANMEPVMYQGEQPGGQLTTTNDVENFPGYPDGITGPEMMIQLQKQAERFGTDVRHGWVTKVDFSEDVHKVWVNGETEIHASTVIISTGASAKYLGLPSEQKYLQLGGGVSACAVCDGFFYKNQEVVIVGAGDSGVQILNEVSKTNRTVYFSGNTNIMSIPQEILGKTLWWWFHKVGFLTANKYCLLYTSPSPRD